MAAGLLIARAVVAPDGSMVVTGKNFLFFSCQPTDGCRYTLAEAWISTVDRRGRSRDERDEANSGRSNLGATRPGGDDVVIDILLARTVCRPPPQFAKLTGSTKGLVVPKSVSLGSLVEGGAGQAYFFVQNFSNSSIQISRFETSCDCLSVHPRSFNVEPGSTIKMTVEFKPHDMSGFQGRLSVEVSGFSPGGVELIKTAILAEIHPTIGTGSPSNSTTSSAVGATPLRDRRDMADRILTLLRGESSQAGGRR